MIAPHPLDVLGGHADRRGRHRRDGSAWPGALACLGHARPTASSAARIRQLIGSPSTDSVPAVATSTSGRIERRAAPARTDRAALPVHRKSTETWVGSACRRGIIGTLRLAAMTLDDLLAREGIRDLVTRYNSYSDTGRFEPLWALFAEHAVMEIADSDGEVAVFAGRDNIEQIFTGAQRRVQAQIETAGPTYVRHFTATHQIDLVDADHATGRCYFAVIVDQRPRSLGPLHRPVRAHRRGVEVRAPPGGPRRTRRHQLVRLLTGVRGGSCQEPVSALWFSRKALRMSASPRSTKSAIHAAARRGLRGAASRSRAACVRCR